MLQENRFQLSKLRSRESCVPAFSPFSSMQIFHEFKNCPVLAVFSERTASPYVVACLHMSSLSPLWIPFLKAGKLATWACGKGDGCPLDAFEEVCIWDNPKRLQHLWRESWFRSQKESENCENGELGCIFQAFQALACLGNPCKDLWCFCADRPSKAQGCKFCDRCWAVVEVVLNVSKVIKSQERFCVFCAKTHRIRLTVKTWHAQDTIHLVSTSIQTIELEDSRVRDFHKISSVDTYHTHTSTK